MSEFRHPALKQLADQQVRFAPPVRRREQLGRAAQLLGEVDPDRVYPYQFVCYRVTDYRTDAYPDLLIPGVDLRHDLRVLIDRLDRSLPALPIEKSPEPMVTLDEVSQQLNVSTKTFRRWQAAHDLVGWRVLVKGRRRLGFPQAAVERFVKAHPSRIERGSRFSHLSESEKDEILTTARQLARTGESLRGGRPVHDPEFRPRSSGLGRVP
jgi:excisionase family DNA binding protein